MTRAKTGVIYYNGKKVAEVRDIEYSVGYATEDAVPIGDGRWQTSVQITSGVAVPRLGRWRRFKLWLRLAWEALR